jgi:Sortase domain
MSASVAALVAVVALASAATIGAAHVGWGSSSHTSRPQHLLRVSQPRPSTSTHGAGALHGGPQAGEPRTAPAHQARPAASQVFAERPVAIVLPNGATMPVLPASTDPSGVLQVPSNIDRAGWWDGGSRVGDPFGAIVVAAHVDSFTQGLGAFAELLNMRPGDEVRLDSRHLRQSFRVVSAHLEPKSSLATDSRVFGADGQYRLVLLTCGGSYDPSHGGYQDNMVIIASAEKSPVRLR